MEKRFITGSTLKTIAIVSMFIDHFGAAVVGPLRSSLPDSMTGLAELCRNIYPVMRDIGRLAFPIFCFLLVEGFLHTRSAVKYAGRLALFALISEFPFDYALKGRFYSPNYQNVYFTLLIGLLVMMGVSYFEKKPWKTDFEKGVYFLLQLVIAAGGLYLARFLHTDYSYKGVFLIEVLYFLRADPRVQAVFGAVAISWETTAPLAFLPIWFYNGQRGRQFNKYFFYWFYPGHLILLGVCRHIIIPYVLTCIA